MFRKNFFKARMGIEPKIPENKVPNDDTAHYQRRSLVIKDGDTVYRLRKRLLVQPPIAKTQQEQKILPPNVIPAKPLEPINLQLQTSGLGSLLGSPGEVKLERIPLIRAETRSTGSTSSGCSFLDSPRVEAAPSPLAAGLLSPISQRRANSASTTRHQVGENSSSETFLNLAVP